MLLKPLSSGKISGTGTVSLGVDAAGGILGAVLISADGTNSAVVILRKDNASGEKLFDFDTITSQMVIAPIQMDGTITLYYDITGTGATAMLYEWVT